MEEVFKTIEGFEDYSVSNLGNVMSRKSNDIRILKPGHDAAGYLHVRIYPREPIFGRYKNGFMKPKLEKIHRLVAKAFLPEPDKDVYMEINHNDGDKHNNDVTNLEWMTRSQNIQHGWDTGLMDNGAHKGAIKRRKPVKITFPDGRVEYYQGRVQAAIYLGVTPLTVLLKFKSGTFGRTKFKAEKIDDLPEGESFVFNEEKEILLKEWNAKYFGKNAKWRIKRRNKLVEEK